MSTALSSQEWFDKLRAWVPSWFFEKEQYQQALFKAIAKLLESMDAQMREHVRDTFLMQAEGLTVDQHGSERSTARLAGESDRAYSARFQTLTNRSNVQQIVSILNLLLSQGTVSFYENRIHGFFDGDFFFDDYESRISSGNKLYNWITIIIPRQTEVDQDVLKASIISAMELNRALGVSYDVLFDAT